MSGVALSDGRRVRTGPELAFERTFFGERDSAKEVEDERARGFEREEEEGLRGAKEEGEEERGGGERAWVVEEVVPGSRRSRVQQDLGHVGRGLVRRRDDDERTNERRTVRRPSRDSFFFLKQSVASTTRLKQLLKTKETTPP